MESGIVQLAHDGDYRLFVFSKSVLSYRLLLRIKLELLVSSTAVAGRGSPPESHFRVYRLVLRRHLRNQCGYRDDSQVLL